MNHNNLAINNQQSRFDIPNAEPSMDTVKIKQFSERLDRVSQAILRAPALPTILPMEASSVGNYAELLADEGFPAIEIMSRPLEAALPLLQEVLSKPVRNRILWGVGTVKTSAEAQAIADLRPDFMVSPAFSRRVLQVAIDRGIPYIPAVSTFQDVQSVIDTFDELGIQIKVLKLCPANLLATEYIQGLVGCYPGISLCPTGNVSLETYVRWINMPAIAAPMGSQLIPTTWIQQGNSLAIRKRLWLIRELWDSRTCSPTNSHEVKIDELN